MWVGVVAALVVSSGCGPLWLGRHREPLIDVPEKITAALARVPEGRAPGLVGRSGTIA